MALEKVSRNRELVEHYKNGLMFKDIADIFKISSTACRDLIHKQFRRDQKTVQEQLNLSFRAVFSQIINREWKLYLSKEEFRKQFPRSNYKELKILAGKPVDYNRSVETLSLSTRTLNGLMNTNILTLEDIYSKSDRELLRIRNFGRRSLEELNLYLIREGLNPIFVEKPLKTKIPRSETFKDAYGKGYRAGLKAAKKAETHDNQ